MPPRKSNLSTVSVDEPETSTVSVDEPTEASPVAPKVYKEPKAPKAPREDDTLSVEDLNLPKSIVQRLAKGVLPPNTQIQKDALLAMSKGATVFVNYLTSAYVPWTFNVEQSLYYVNSCRLRSANVIHIAPQKKPSAAGANP